MPSGADNDPSIPEVGKPTRRTAIDELPQFPNAIRGHVSCCAEPAIEDEVSLRDSAACRRLLAKPGLTGYWRVKGRTNPSWNGPPYWDIYYIENHSILTRIQIPFGGFEAVMMEMEPNGFCTPPTCPFCLHASFRAIEAEFAESGDLSPLLIGIPHRLDIFAFIRFFRKSS